MRFQDWPERLVAFIDFRRNDPFAWGTRDCVALANDWIEECTGTRPLNAVHKTQKEAEALIKSLGGLESAISQYLGDPREFPLSAQRGDVCLFDGDMGPAMGVVIGAEFAAQGKNGLLSFPITMMRVSWAVGRG